MRRFLIAVAILPTFPDVGRPDGQQPPAIVPLEAAVAARLRTAFFRYDSHRQVLVSYADAKNRSAASVIAVRSSGEKLAEISALQDFPNANEVDVWDATALDHGIALAAVIQDGRPPRHAILIYGADGRVRHLWQTSPYHHHKIVADAQGNIFAFGHRIDRKSSSRPDTPLIIKYDAGGKVAREFLPASSLAGHQSPIIGRDGDSQLWIAGNRLRLYAARSREILEFDLDGILKLRIPVDRQLEQLKEYSGATRVQVIQIPDVDDATGVIAQIALFSDHAAPIFRLVRFDFDGSVAAVMAQPSSEFGTPAFPLLGTIHDRLLYLNSRDGAFVTR